MDDEIYHIELQVVQSYGPSIGWENLPIAEVVISYLRELLFMVHVFHVGYLVCSKTCLGARRLVQAIGFCVQIPCQQSCLSMIVNAVVLDGTTRDPYLPN